MRSTYKYSMRKIYKIEGPFQPSGWCKEAETDAFSTAEEIAKAFGRGAAIFRVDTGNCVLRYN
jgi:hypothetical protein